jgi:hypothetical protein
MKVAVMMVLSLVIVLVGTYAIPSDSFRVKAAVSRWISFEVDVRSADHGGPTQR